MIEAGGFTLIANAMRTHPRVDDLVCNAMYALAEMIGDGVISNSKSQNAACSADVIALVLVALRTLGPKQPLTAASACRVVRDLCRANPSIQVIFANVYVPCDVFVVSCFVILCRICGISIS